MIRGAPSVVLLHCSGSSGRQWQPLMDRLHPRYRPQAVDLYGHGATPAWPLERAMRLDDDAARVQPLLASSAEGVHLVGHSYGGAVALKLALRHPHRVRSIVVFEPVVFRLLFDYNAGHAPAVEIRDTGRSIRDHLALGMIEAGARRFVDYWSGQGAWRAMPAHRRQSIMARLPAIVAQFHALFQDDASLASLTGIAAPMLVLTGARTCASTRRIGELLGLALPRARHEALEGMGHMGPITHAQTVAARIARFLDAQSASSDAKALRPRLGRSTALLPPGETPRAAR